MTREFCKLRSSRRGSTTSIAWRMRWAWEEVEMKLRRSAQICGWFLLLLFAFEVQAQEDVVKTKSNLVNIDVIVKDKKGKYVSDLKPEDFTITENGQPQKIEFFDAPLSLIEVRKPGEQAAAASSTPATATAPRHYVSLVLDFQTTDVTNLKQVREGAIKYIREPVSYTHLRA